MKKIVIAISSLFVFQGCSSIEQPVAKRPLVEQAYVYPSATTNETLASALSNGESGLSILDNGQEIVLGNRFFAASGWTCRKLDYKRSQTKTFCFANTLWFEAKNVIAEYTETKDVGAK